MKQSFNEFDIIMEKERKLLFGNTLKRVDDMSVSKMKMSTIIRDLDESSVTNETMISDVSYAVPEINEEIGIQKYVISYNNRFKSVWDILIMTLVIYSSITTAYLYIMFTNSSNNI